MKRSSATDMQANYPEEPLGLSAPLARELAQRLCRADPTRGSCAWYHGFWQYVRLLDFGTTPRDHADFYREALLGPISAGDRRILVSGTADYAMPACILWIGGLAGVKPDLTVLDICPTPLRLCEWYADHIGACFETVAQDIHGYETQAPFDIVTTHSFLGRFPPERRPALFARWHRLLRPGGRVVTINRIRAGAPDKVRFAPEQAERFAARVREAAAGLTTPFDVTTDALAEMARVYAATTSSSPVRSTDDILQLFETAGFRVERLDVRPVAPRAPGTPSGPTMSDGSGYARVVAVRR